MASNSYRPSSSGRNPNHRLRIAQCVLIVVLLAILFLVITMLSSGDHQPADTQQGELQNEEELLEQMESGKFHSGVIVNGVDIGKMTADEARSALRSSVENQVNNVSVTLSFGGRQWVLDSSAAALESNLEEVLQEAMLQKEAATYTTSVHADPDELARFVSEIAAEVNQEPVNATAEYDASNDPPFRYVDGQNGYQVDQDAVVAELASCLEEGSSSLLEITASVTEPTTTTADLKANTSQISQFSTTFSTKDKNRTYNLNLACEKLNGYVIKPGTTFSFNDVVGPRDEANGWKEAHVIVNGSRYEDGWGGGICQVSTTLYNALLLTGSDFSNFSRKNHSILS